MYAHMRRRCVATAARATHYSLDAARRSVVLTSQLSHSPLTASSNTKSYYTTMATGTASSSQHMDTTMLPECQQHNSKFLNKSNTNTTSTSYWQRIYMKDKSIALPGRAFIPDPQQDLVSTSSSQQSAPHVTSNSQHGVSTRTGRGITSVLLSVGRIHSILRRQYMSPSAAAFSSRSDPTNSTVTAATPVSETGDAISGVKTAPHPQSIVADPRYTIHEEPQRPATRDLRLMLEMAKPEMKIISVGAVCLLAAAGITMYVPTAFGRIIDIVGGVDTGVTLQSFASGLAALLGVGAVAAFGRVYCFNVAGHRLIARLRKRLFSNLMDQQIAFFDHNRSGDLITRLSTDTVVMARSLTGIQLSAGIRNFAQGIAGFAYMMFLSPKLTAVMVGIVPIVAIGGLGYGRFVKKLALQVQTALGKSTAVASERLGNIRTVRSFAAEDLERGRYGQEVENVFSLAKREALANAGFFSSANFAGSMMVLGVLFTGGKMVMAGELTTGVLTSFLLYTFYTGASVVQLAGFYSDVMKGIGASHRVFELIDPQQKGEPAEVLEDRATRQKRLSAQYVYPDSIQGDIEFRDLSFSYPTRPHHKVLDGLSLTLKRGDIVAVVGASGSGKSTLAWLLLRFYEPDNGQVMLDGRDIQTLDPDWLRNNCAIVSQEPVLFGTTIYENIRYGCPDATEEEVYQAARESHADTFVRAFPQGYNTEVGERGVSLSGGQKQRIAIARALLKNPTVLILDEATSALDAESEALVQDAMNRLMKNRTVIVIAHRLSTIQSADRIAVMGNGRIEEIGTHADLMQHGGFYKRLMSFQIREPVTSETATMTATDSEEESTKTE
jgi:ATP-binding cassette, subfamily B (MDR/TAP), member 10